MPRTWYEFVIARAVRALLNRSVSGQYAENHKAYRRKRGYPYLAEPLEPRCLLSTPFVQSINRTNPAGAYTNAASVNYTVTFSESVTGVDASDFKLYTAGNVVANPVVAVSGGGSAYVVTINDIHGSGDIRLDLIDNDSINSAGTPLGGVGSGNASFQGQSYTILQAFPRLLSINRTNPSGPLTGASSVVYTTTFSAPVTGVDAGDFQLSLDGVNASPPVIGGSGSIYTATVNNITGGGSLRLDLVDNGSIRDAMGNPLQSNGVSFASQATYAAAKFPSSIAVADQDGDNIPDLVVTNQNVASLGIFRGNGDGTFQGQTTIATGVGPTHVVSADTNGDAIPDLIVLNAGYQNVGSLLGNGDGTFLSQATFATGSWPIYVVVADLSGDGKPDLSIANYFTNVVSFLLGNGDGAFQNQTLLTAKSHTHSITTADVNGDGKPDLTVANQDASSVSVLLGNGDGTFQGQVTFATSAHPHSVDSADQNGDGKPDLVLAFGDSVSGSVMLGNGDGTFQSQITFATPYNSPFARSADVNGDGKPDLIYCGYGRNCVSVLLGNGDGTFQAQITFATA